MTVLASVIVPSAIIDSTSSRGTRSTVRYRSSMLTAWAVAGPRSVDR